MVIPRAADQLLMLTALAHLSANEQQW